MNKIRESFLIVGGIANVAIALLHLVIIFLGAPAYRLFGAGETMARMAEEGSVIPGIVTFVLTLFFILFALYAFSGANVIPRLPYLKKGLIIIGAVYCLRGLMLLPALIMENAGAFETITSLAAFIIGLCYLIGSIGFKQKGRTESAVEPGN
ncbi:MAG: hypothetical protein GF307_03845 [candidate division Zixibacteria bacterium]|nr:hypothetical protein [candidate division Zixibacteria bacterium]